VIDGLLHDGRIAVRRSALFDAPPSPLPAGFDFDRVEGMLLGLAVGDSLGNTSESQAPADRRTRYGEIRDYLPNYYASGRRVGTPSDDTQLTFWTLEHLLEHGRLVPDALARLFCGRRIFGIGRTVATFVDMYSAQGKPWYEAGQPSAANGAPMRIAPVLVPHLPQPSADLWADAVIAAMLTHNDPAAIGSCVALVRLLWEALRAPRPPEPGWWLDLFCETLRPLEGETAYRTRTPHYSYTGPLWRFTREAVGGALAGDLTVAEACDRWYSGAYLLETIPSVLYVLCRHAHDPEEAIVRAVNDTRDNDTVGAIVGALVGALHGRRGLPDRWIAGLLGRTREDDDGRVFELIAAARQRWSMAGCGMSDAE
jgi:ADP-ribosylglycohydrolase